LTAGSTRAGRGRTLPGRAAHLLRDRNFLLISSLVLGLVVGKGARATSWLNLPVMALAMTVSLTGISSGDFSSWRRVARFVLAALTLTYIINGGLLLLLGKLLISDPQLWIGLVLLAATPSGIAAIPFSYVLGGDASFALVGTVGAYLAAIAVMPLLATALLGSAVIEPVRLVTTLVQLVVVPLVVSRAINATRLKEPISRWRGTIVNWSFALIIFTVIGLNRDALLQQPQVVLTLALIGLATNFGLGWALEKVLRWRHVGRATMLTSVILGTVKNTSLTAATILALLGERASLPAAMVSVTNVLYLVFLGVHWGERK